LLDSYLDPEVGQFKLRIQRRHARDLRKGLFGPKGLRDVPKGECVRAFDLPNGWTLRLTYDVPPDDWTQPGNVVAESIPPTRQGRVPTPRHLALADEVHPRSTIRLTNTRPSPMRPQTLDQSVQGRTHKGIRPRFNFGQLHFQPLEQAWTT
jgi:hypothetical protein